MASTGPRHSPRLRRLKSISVLEYFRRVCFHLLEQLDVSNCAGHRHPARPPTLTYQWLSWDGTISLGSNASDRDSDYLPEELLLVRFSWCGAKRSLGMDTFLSFGFSVLHYNIDELTAMRASGGRRTG